MLCLLYKRTRGTIRKETGISSRLWVSFMAHYWWRKPKVTVDNQTLTPVSLNLTAIVFFKPRDNKEILFFGTLGSMLFLYIFSCPFHIRLRP